MGASHVLVPPHEQYTAVEQGIADAALTTAEFAYSTGLFEHLKYWVDHGIFGRSDCWVINPDVWNGLPKHLQDVMIEAQIEYEHECPDVYKNQVGMPHKQKLMDEGVEFTTFPPDEAQRYRDSWVNASWESLLKQHPEEVGKFKSFMDKR